MIGFLKEHKAIMGYGMLLTFFSGYGQTFLISLFVPHFCQAYCLSNMEFGSIYGGITFASATALVYLGKLADTYSVQKYTLFVVLLLAVSLTLSALSFHVSLFILGLWGIRLAGQGLLPHTAATVMSRSFGKDRGKALSISTLGHPAGEAAFPLLITLLIGYTDWRTTLLIGAVFLLFIMLPYLFLMVNFSEYQTAETTGQQKEWSQWEVLRSKEFLLIAPATFIVTFLTTALFLYQLPLAQSRGWSAEWIAFCLTGFALARVVSTLTAGWLTDKFGARNIFPLYLLPFFLGLIILLIFSEQWAAYLYLFLTGITIGLGGTIKSALQAEIFGVTSIGAVRSLFSTLVVLSTALGPVLFGVLMDLNVTFSDLILLSIILLLLTTIWNFRIGPSYSRKRVITNSQ